MDKACFIDLQGTLGGEGLDHIVNFEFYSFSEEALKIIKSKGYKVLITTNQSSVAKGIISLNECNEELRKLKTLNFIDGVYCCPHNREDECDCKKPKRGMIDQAVNDFDIDISESYVIGDMGLSDMLLAKEINSKSILVLTGVGEGSLTEFRHTWSDTEPTYVAKDILEAATKYL